MVNHFTMCYPPPQKTSPSRPLSLAAESHYRLQCLLANIAWSIAACAACAALLLECQVQGSLRT